jgi:hypothetical protein
MSSQNSIVYFVSNIINLRSPDIVVLAQGAQESLLLTVKVYGDSPNLIAQFLSVILHLRSHPDIVARIKPVDESLVLTSKVSGESLIDLERSQPVETAYDPTTSLAQPQGPSNTPSEIWRSSNSTSHTCTIPQSS